MRKFLLIFWSILMFTGCGAKEEDLAKKYEELDNKFIEGAQSYIATNPMGEKEFISIKLESLYIGKFLKEKLVDPESENECDKQNSFIHIRVTDGEIAYTPYLKCDNYTTEN